MILSPYWSAEQHAHFFVTQEDISDLINLTTVAKGTEAQEQCARLQKDLGYGRFHGAVFSLENVLAEPSDVRTLILRHRIAEVLGMQ